MGFGIHKDTHSMGNITTVIVSTSNIITINESVGRSRIMGISKVSQPRLH